MDVIRFHLDGEAVEVRDLPPTTTVLQWLRRHARRPGTKEGCAEGDCGACTIAVLDGDAPGGPRWRAVHACITLLPMLHGRRVVTVEGLADGAALHPVQDAMVRHLGSQCGYCTPGVVMTLFEACYRGDLEEPWQLDDQMCGTLCRCTGYRPIRDAAREIAGLRPDDRFRADEAVPVADRSLEIAVGDQRFFLPTSWDALFDAIEAHPDHRLVAGGTDLGLEVTRRGIAHGCLISLEAVPGLREIRRAGGIWRVGAGVLLADLEDATRDALVPVARMLRYFGARQIKNRGTVGGNLCNASPIGDLAPILLALDANVVLRGRHTERRVPLDDFFVGYRDTALAPGEILAAVEIPELPEDARAAAYKVSKRRELDISTVAAGMVVRVDAAGTVTGARLGFGGMAAIPARARSVEAALVGRPWTRATVEEAAAGLDRDFTPIDDHRGSAWYRRTVARNLVLGFFEETRRVHVPRLPHRNTGTVIPEGT